MTISLAFACKVALTVCPDFKAFFMALPLEEGNITTGILGKGAVPSLPIVMISFDVLTTKTASAPASSALITFSLNLQVPRSTTNILPLIAAALVNVPQANADETESCAIIKIPVIGLLLMIGPKVARPTL